MRGGLGGPAAPASNDSSKPNDEDDAAWLAYSDQMRGGTGFVAWKKIPHPQLGEVEVGGWVPGFKDNPPLDEVRPVGEKAGEFVAKLAASRPKVELRAPQVTQVAPGLYRIDAELANVGRLPTIMRGGRAVGIVPANVVRVSTPIDRIRSGRRMVVVRGMDPGEVRQYEWIVSAAPDEVVAVELLYGGAACKRYAFRDGQPVDAPEPPAAPAAPAQDGGAK
jgi:hypothetical protein